MAETVVPKGNWISSGMRGKHLRLYLVLHFEVGVVKWRHIMHQLAASFGVLPSLIESLVEQMLDEQEERLLPSFIQFII